MGTINQQDRTTRREFLELSSVALATAGLLGDGSAAKAAEMASTVDATQSGSTLMARKIALEEHFVLPESVDTTYAIRDLPTPELRQKVLDVGGGRIAEMDRGGVEISILSHAAVGAQAILNVSQAIAFSMRANDYLAEHIAKYPKRLKGFAALPMQDPQVAAQELTRCVKELGFCGALVNGFSQFREANSAVFYDLPQYRAFWATVQELDVPFYLHPRAPLPTRQQAYEGYAWLSGSPWGFGAETSIHATPDEQWLV